MKICVGDPNRCHIVCKILSHSVHITVVTSRFLEGGALFVDTLYIQSVEKWHY